MSDNQSFLSLQAHTWLVVMGVVFSILGAAFTVYGRFTAMEQHLIDEKDCARLHQEK